MTGERYTWQHGESLDELADAGTACEIAAREQGKGRAGRIDADGDSVGFG